MFFCDRALREFGSIQNSLCSLDFYKVVFIIKVKMGFIVGDVDGRIQQRNGVALFIGA